MGKTYRKNDFHYRNYKNYISENDVELQVRKSIWRNYIRAQRCGEWVPMNENELEASKEKGMEIYEAQMLVYKTRFYFYEMELKDYEKTVERFKNDPEFRKNYTGVLRVPTMPRKPVLYYEKNKRVPLTKTFEEFFAERYEGEMRWEKKHFSRGRFRDGVYNETGRNQGYKKQCNRKIRSNNRCNVKKIMSGHDSEDMIWEDRKDGKQYVWNWW